MTKHTDPNYKTLLLAGVAALSMLYASAARATYTFYYRCGDVRVAAAWKRARDGAGVNGVWFSGYNIRNFKMRSADEPPTLNGKPCKKVTEAEGMEWER